MLQRILEAHASESMTKIPDVFSQNELIIIGFMFNAMDRDHDDYLDVVDLLGYVSACLR